MSKLFLYLKYLCVAKVVEEVKLQRYLAKVVEKLFMKNISPKTYFFLLVTSCAYSIRLTANRRAQIDSGDPGLSFGYLTILLASIVIEIIATFCDFIKK